MTNILFGVMGNNGIPADEKVVRSTATPVDIGAAPAMQKEAPEWNEPVEPDGNPQLGMVNRSLASHWVEGQQSSPFWEGQVNQQAQYNFLIDQQVSTSGTAAAREAAGQFGHGTASYAIGIEPVGDLRDGGKMGNDYFAANNPPVQEGMGDYMSVPPGTDQATTARVAATGKQAARDAGLSPYDVMWKGINS